MGDDLTSQTAISKAGLQAEEISRRIYMIRGQRVMLDADLARDEDNSLRSQFVTLKKLRRGKHRARKVDALEKMYDAQFRVVFDAIRALMEPPIPPGRRIGF